MDGNVSYYTNFRSELLAFVPEGIKTTLDIGCGEGVFSDVLKNQYGVEAWGVEIVEEAAKKAASKLDKVLVGDFDDVYEGLPQAYFDCIFYNDVLEHMVCPYSALMKSKPLLSTNGVIVCSIPNVRYFLNLFELLVNKDWEYKDAGILDRTHLRFFTKKSICRMFKELDFDLLRIEGVNPMRSRKYKLLYYLLNIIFAGAFRDSCHLQYVCVVTPA